MGIARKNRSTETALVATKTQVRLQIFRKRHILAGNESRNERTKDWADELLMAQKMKLISFAIP